MSVAPPQGGTPPPATTRADGTEIELRPLALEICRRYREEFPDEEGRYGDAGQAWCVHDNQWILHWAVVSVVDGSDLLERRLAWLAGVLGARDFPLERLVRDVELAAEVVRDAHPEAAGVLLRAAGSVRPPL